MSALPAAELFTPACMEPDELSAWRASERRLERNSWIPMSQYAATPCVDCTLGFAAEMRAVGRCNGQPGGVEEDEDMEVAQIHSRGTSVPVGVALIAPCERCIHVQVCAIKESVEDAKDATVDLPKLHSALSATISVSIDCGFFVPEKGARKMHTNASTEPQVRRRAPMSEENRARLSESMKRVAAERAARLTAAALEAHKNGTSAA